MKHLVNTIWERSRCGLSDSWLVVLNDGGAGAEPVRPKSVRVLGDVGSDRRGRPRTAAVPEKSVRVLRDGACDRRGCYALPLIEFAKMNSAPDTGDIDPRST
jgi:hypothetical protein